MHDESIQFLGTILFPVFTHLSHFLIETVRSRVDRPV